MSAVAEIGFFDPVLDAEVELDRLEDEIAAGRAPEALGPMLIALFMHAIVRRRASTEDVLRLVVEARDGQLSIGEAEELVNHARVITRDVGYRKLKRYREQIEAGIEALQEVRAIVANAETGLTPIQDEPRMGPASPRADEPRRRPLDLDPTRYGRPFRLSGLSVIHIERASDAGHSYCGLQRVHGGYDRGWDYLDFYAGDAICVRCEKIIEGSRSEIEAQASLRASYMRAIRGEP